MNRREIRSEVFLREDIQSILRAIDAANSEIAARFPEEEIACYRAGFADALQAVATAFHASLSSEDSAGDYRVSDSLPQSRRIRVLDHAPSTGPLERGTAG